MPEYDEFDFDGDGNESTDEAADGQGGTDYNGGSDEETPDFDESDPE